MAPDYWFYRLDGHRLVSALGLLLEKSLERGWRVLVLAGSAQLDELDRGLWTYRDGSFLAHGLATEPEPEAQPVLLAPGPQAEPANGAKVLTVLDTASIEALAERLGDSGFARHMILFDAADAELCAAVKRLYALVRDKARYFYRGESGWVEQSKHQAI